jgi:hypothetical protein
MLIWILFNSPGLQAGENDNGISPKGFLTPHFGALIPIKGLKPHKYHFVIFVPGLKAGAIEKQSICSQNGIRFKGHMNN